MPKPDLDGAPAPELSPEDLAVFTPWLRLWDLVPDGQPFSGNSSRLVPVRRGGQRLVLKAAMEPREIRAAGYLRWLDGDGAAKVLERRDDAILMERVTGERSLQAMEDAGEHEAALGIMCALAARLHAPRPAAPPEVHPLPDWFQRLHEVGAPRGGALRRASEAAKTLLAEPRDPRILHGDLHQWNVLDGGARGWLAIDPNGLAGERGFEFALMVLPANLVDDADPQVLRRRAHLVARLADIEPRRLLTWVMAQAALWEAWGAPGRDWLAIAEAAERALD